MSSRPRDARGSGHAVASTVLTDAPLTSDRRATGVVPAVTLGAAVAVALGGFSWWADQLSYFGIPEATPEYVAFGVLQVFGNGPTLWLIGAFAVGFAAGRIAPGVVLATASLLLAVGVYYALIIVTDTRPGANLGPSALAWAAVAIVAGPPLGGAGALVAGPPGRGRLIGAGALGGALVGVGLWLFAVPVAAVIHVACGAATAAWLAGPGRHIAGGALALALGAIAFGLVQATFAMVWTAIR